MKVNFEIKVSSEEGLKLLMSLLEAEVIGKGKKIDSTPCTVGVDLGSTPDMTVHTPIPNPNYAPVVQAPVVQAPVVTPLPAVVNYVAPVVATTGAETYTLEQLAVAASTQHVDAGKRNELVDLLGLFGIQSMGQLPVESYGLFATHLRSKGVHI